MSSFPPPSPPPRQDPSAKRPEENHEIPEILEKGKEENRGIRGILGRGVTADQGPRNTQRAARTAPALRSTLSPLRCFSRVALVSCFIVSALFAFSHVYSQEALRSALSIDSALAPRQAASFDLQPDRPHLGPVQLTFGAYAGAEFNGNINGAQINPQSDTLLRAGLDVGAFWSASERSVLQFGAGLGYVYYVNHTQDGGLEITPNSALTWQIGFPDGNIAFYDQFSYQQQLTQVAAVANTTTIPRIDNTIGTRVSWEPLKWILQTGYGYDTYFSTDSSYQYLNRASHFLFLRAGRHLAEQTQAGVESSATFTTYEQSYQNNATSISAGGYAEWQITKDLSAVVRGGPSFYLFNSNPNPTDAPTSDLHSYYAGVSVNHALTESISHSINLTRDVSLGIEQGSSYIEQFTGNYTISFALTRYLSLNANATYEQGNQPLLYPVPGLPGLSVSVKENFNRYGFGVGVSRSITDHISAALRYAYWNRHSSLPDRGYDQNIVSLELHYTF